jgi:hypothetical protein
MRRTFMIAAIAGLLVATIASCAGKPPATVAAGVSSAGAPEDDIYVQVLTRYLGTPAENSFPDRTFPAVYVLDRTYPDAGDPSGKPQPGLPIGPDAQHAITAALAGTGHLTFVADRASVLETKDGCPQVKGGGILITLGPAEGDDREVHIGINGFVACLGATWLTYVVQRQTGGGWRVTGTTGSMSIS